MTLIAQWLRKLPECAGSAPTGGRCGKPSAGVLMSNRNEEIGPRCQRCADARIRQDKRTAR